MSLKTLLKAAPHKDEIQNSEAVEGQYKYWRWRIFLSMYVGYVFFYFSRQSFTFAMPSLMQDLNFTKADLGILVSVLSLMYGLSKFLSGILSDRSNPRYLIEYRAHSHRGILYFIRIFIICMAVCNFPRPQWMVPGLGMATMRQTINSLVLSE